MPRNPEQSGIDAGGDAARRPDGKCHREYTADFEVSLRFQRVRVKRWSKSPPLQAQARRHGKPHRVQGQIGDHGAARSIVPHRGTSPGYWLLRQMILSSRKREDKIRLIALPKSFRLTRRGSGDLWPSAEVAAPPHPANRARDARR